jgi:hypothetical protein
LKRSSGDLRSRHCLQSRRGAASALIILLLVLLIFFGVLSLVTAGADWRLSQKRSSWNQQFYLADGGAVKLLAELDQFCRSLPETDTEAGMMAGRLDEWLAGRADILEYEVTPGDESLQLMMLAGEEPATAPAGSQGIRVTVLVKTGVVRPAERLTVAGWTQWQPPFEYDTEGGGIWKG